MRQTAWLGLMALLAGCAAPGRETTQASTELTAGVISTTSTGAMTDCLLDGFGKAHWLMTNTRVAQQHRSDGSRVETYTGNILLVSADVKDDGHVALIEMSNAKFVSTSGEREAFATCLAKYKQ